MGITGVLAGLGSGSPWLWLAQAGSMVDPAETVPELAQINLFQAIVIGIVQGFTEFLPISSTAHVKIVPVLLGWGDPGVAFTAVIQLGSIAAILWYFWADLVQVTMGMIRATWAARTDRSQLQSTDFRLGAGILLGTVPIIVAGLAIKLFLPNFDQSPLRNTVAIGIASIVMALLLAAAEILSTHKRNFDNLGLMDGVNMGIAQALAVIPGVSRAGATLTAGLFMGLERSTAARFSFLMGIPAITLAGLVELGDLLDPSASNITLGALIGGLIATIISSYLSIVWLINFLKNHTTWVFVWYRLAFGIALIAGVMTQVIDNI